MKALLRLVLFVLLPASLLAQAPSKLMVSNPPLTSDQITIYRTFLFSYNTGLDAPINLADQTVKFTTDPSDQKGCLKEFAASTAAVTFHRFSTEFADLSKIQLVDPNTHKIADPGIAIRQGDSVDHAVKSGLDAGVLTLSEVVFDPTHHFAAFSYTFHCGALCGSGGIVVYELKNGKWERSKHSCNIWVS